MPTRTLSDEAMRTLALFEETTGVAATDCVIDDEFDRAIVLVDPADMADAIGPGGHTVREAEERLGRDLKLVEDADTAEDFVANALAPAAVYDVEIEAVDDGDATRAVARVDVDEADVGVAIGPDGRNVDAARVMAVRHFEVDDVQVV